VSDGTVLVAYLHPATDIQHSFHVSLTGLVNYDVVNNQRLFASSGPFMVRTGTGGLVDSRNKAVAHFLDSSPEEWLWFVDTDMGFEPDVVDRLVAAADPVERPVVGALCFGMKQGDPDGFGGYVTTPFPTLYGWWKNPDGAEGFINADGYPQDTAVKVAATGAACLLIHRSVLEKVRAEHGDTWFEQVKYGDGRMVSEDLSFCYKLGMLDIPVHVHTGIKTTHAKTIWVGEDEFLRHKMIAQMAFAVQEVAADAVPD
jgi:GT2 family glycosyltransferase